MGIFDFMKPKPKTEYEIAKENKAGYYSAEKDYWEAVRLMNEGQGKKAFDLYMKCANKNHKRAQYMVGACYEDGIGVEKNYDKAFEWYTRTISDYHNGTFYYCRDNVAGYTWAKYRLGLLHMWGLGTPQSKPKAEEMFYFLSELAGSKIFDCEKEVAFLACKEIYANYSNGSNGFPQSYTPAHRWALKTLNAYDFAVKYDSEESREFKRKYAQNHHWTLQFVAYNLENGRGVDKNLEQGTKYRRKAAEMYNDGDDAYWTGRNYEQLGNRDAAKEMYRFATQQNDEKYKKKANERLSEIAREEAEWKTKASERGKEILFVRLKKSPAAEDYLDAAHLYLHGYVAVKPDPAVEKYLPVEDKINLSKGLYYLLELVMSDVQDKTPLPDEFLMEVPEQGEYGRQNGLENYVRARFKEKLGNDFTEVLKTYTTSVMCAHIESAFRVAQLISMLEGTTFDYAYSKMAFLKIHTRPTYDTHSKPTLALVQLAKRQDPEAIVDLARIYRGKDQSLMEELLLKAACIIYKERIQSGEPEAMYRYAAIQAHVRKEIIWKLLDESPYYYMFYALSRGYAMAYADFSHNKFSKYLKGIDDELQAKYRATADINGAKLDVYIDYTVENEIYSETDKAVSDFDKYRNLPADDRYFYFKRVYEFVVSKKPFNSPELHRLIDEGVVDKLGDKEMIDLIKKLAAYPEKEL